MQQGILMSLRLQRLFLELKPLQHKWEAQQLVQQCPVQQVGPFVKGVEQPVPVPLYSMHILSILRLHPGIVATSPAMQEQSCLAVSG